MAQECSEHFYLAPKSDREPKLPLGHSEEIARLSSVPTHDEMRLAERDRVRRGLGTILEPFSNTLTNCCPTPDDFPNDLKVAHVAFGNQFGLMCGIV